MLDTPRFRMGALDHVHIRVPNMAEALTWYSTRLGFAPVPAYDFWAEGVDGGPVQISADDGRTCLALFEANERSPMVPQTNGVAFSVDAETFVSFVRSLPNGIDHPDGGRLTAAHLVDFDLCWAIDLVDPWGNRYELNCYDHDRVRVDLVEADGLTPDRKWPADLFTGYPHPSDAT
jgi:catechol 2,3-dioxygenase-like lactoylglutathione lyase family enzyme